MEAEADKVEYKVGIGVRSAVPQYTVSEDIRAGKMGSHREVAWFWDKSDAEEYAVWMREKSKINPAVRDFHSGPCEVSDVISIKRVRD